MEKILIIEHDRAVQKALRRLFESEGYGIDVKADGKSALEAFRATAPAAIVLDLRLPAMTGRDVCREIKRENPALPIVVLSATTDVTDKVLLLELGADDYVTKPEGTACPSARDHSPHPQAAGRRVVLFWHRLRGFCKNGNYARRPTDKAWPKYNCEPNFSSRCWSFLRV